MLPLAVVHRRSSIVNPLPALLRDPVLKPISMLTSMPIRHLTLFVLLACCIEPTAAARSMAQLPPAVTRALNQSGVPAKNVSIFVQDANTHETIVDLNADRPRSPASTIKVLTSFAALDMLGPAYTWKTHAYLGGRLSNGVLHGDLILVGEGDPFMTIERWWSFVQQLRELGLTKITGDIVIDNSYFAPIPQSRADFDAQPFRSYNVIPDALMVNFQTSRFTFTATAQDSRPRIAVNPMPANLKIVNRARVSTGRCQGYNRGLTFDSPTNDPNTIVIGGTFATSCRSFSINRAIMNAPDYAYGTFRTLWENSGGEIGGGMRVARRPDDARHFHTFDSISLAEVVRLVNKFSNNVMARHLLLTLGAEKFGPPTTVELGRNAVRAWLAERNVNMPGFVLDNGSGLSRDERVTARGLAQVIDHAWHSPFMPEFAASLPLSATDGTLRNRFRAAGMQGRLRLKTGRIDNVNALAGFVNAASGKTYVVVIILNHPQAHIGVGEPVLSELVRWVFGQ
jgi:D-alanyl-D-alanine carboxypeptidase/D-alanyl-D-alanine-endopeptidase (penicillin-binding protein 4)